MGSSEQHLKRAGDQSISAFLKARFDDDEYEARARRGLFPSPGLDDFGTLWLHIGPGGNAVLVRQRDPDAAWADRTALRNWAGSENGWTQERVLLEVDAKRRMLDAHAEHDEVLHFCRNCGSTAGPCETKRLLALPYASHPGYRQGWAPSA